MVTQALAIASVMKALMLQEEEPKRAREAATALRAATTAGLVR
jgi:hypothetical protein